jgi:hypothetical protein
MSKLRLGPLPKTELVKVTIGLPIGLKTDLDHYAALYGEAYGESVDAAMLIPHIVASFIGKDRAFQRVRKRGIKPG